MTQRFFRFKEETRTNLCTATMQAQLVLRKNKNNNKNQLAV
jgi:hypothetical protein